MQRSNPKVHIFILQPESLTHFTSNLRFLSSTFIYAPPEVLKYKPRGMNKTRTNVNSLTETGKIESK